MKPINYGPIIVLGIAVIAGICYLAVNNQPNQPSINKLTRANYDAITTEQTTRAETIALIGEPRTCRAQTGDELSGGEIYKQDFELCWWGYESDTTSEPFATISFDRGIVAKKSMGNLK